MDRIKQQRLYNQIREVILRNKEDLPFEDCACLIGKTIGFTAKPLRNFIYKQLKFFVTTTDIKYALQDLRGADGIFYIELDK